MCTFRALGNACVAVILLAGGLAGTSTPDAAAEPLPLPLAGVAGGDTSTAAGYATALRVAGADERQVASTLKLTSDDALIARSVVVDRPDQVQSATLVHVRFDRTYKGLPVEGGQVLVGATAAGQITAVRGTDPINIASIVPRLTEAEAGHAAVMSSDLAEPKVAHGELVVFMSGDRPPSLSWAVTLSRTTKAGDGDSAQRVFVDAQTGSVLGHSDLDDPVLDPRRTASRAEGSQPHSVSSQAATQLQPAAAGVGHTYYGGTVGIDAQQITLGNGQQTYALQDPGRGGWYTEDFRNGQVYTDPNNVWGNGSLQNSATVAADVQYGIARTWDFFRGALGRQGIDGRGSGTYSQVHYTDEPGNAEWDTDCNCARFGDGVAGVTAGPMVSLDIVAHEYTHAIQIAAHGVSQAGEPSEIEESISDMFGAGTTFDAGNASEPGTYIMGYKVFPASGMRHMDNPSVNDAGVNCYANNPFRNKYVGAGIGNHMFYLLAEGSGTKTINGVTYNSPTCDGSTVVGAGRAVAERVWYRAATTTIASNSKWVDARNATILSARELYGDGSSQCLSVEQAWQAVGVPAGSQTCGTGGSGGSGVVPDAGMNSLLNDYGNTAGCADWSGADATDSVVLPGGDRAYFFSDSYLGSPSERPGAFFHSNTRNSIIVQHGRSLRTITGGNTCQEHNTSLDFWSRYANTSVTSGTNDGSWYWTGEAKVVGSNVIKFYYRNVPQGGFWIETNTAIATIPISTLENQSVINLVPQLMPAQSSYGAHPIIWGTSMLDVGPWTYIYGWGVVDGSNNKRFYVARTEPGNLANYSQWQFNTGGGADSWSARGDQSAAHPVTNAFYVEAGFTVIQANGSYWLVGKDPNLNGGSIVARVGTTPWTFTSSRTTLYTPPEGPRDAGHFFQFYYEARVHPGLTGRGNDVVISYNVNTTAETIGCRSLNDHNAAIYRPRFIDVPLGKFTPTFSLATQKPGTAVAPGQADPRGIHTKLRPPPRGMQPTSAMTTTTTTALTPFANTGIYDQWAPEQQLNHGCPMLNQSTSLSATANPDGTAGLSWTDYGTDMWYWVSHRDATAGDGFQRYLLWSAAPSLWIQAVTSTANQGDRFEWIVTPFADGDPTQDNEAPASNSAGQTVTVAPPSAPSTVTAYRTSATTAAVSWSSVTYPSNGVYYYAVGCGPLYPDPCGTVAGPYDYNVNSATVSIGATDMYMQVWAANIGGRGPSTSVPIAGSSGTGKASAQPHSNRPR